MSNVPGPTTPRAAPPARIDRQQIEQTTDDVLRWLRVLPRAMGAEEASQLAAWVACRGALRVLPLAWRELSGPVAIANRKSVLPVLRSLLTASVAAARPSDTLRAAAALADSRATAFDDMMDPGRHAISAAAYAARSAALDGKASDIASIAFTTLHEAKAAAVTGARQADRETAAFAIWTNAERDKNLATPDALREPPALWADPAGPFDMVWADIKARSQGTHWTFWIDWYDGILAGRPQNWTMLTEIASIQPALWDAGADVVNPMIQQIARKHGMALTVELFTTTLYDFRFDALRKVMQAVPLPRDWQTLTDPAALAEFLSDAVELREDIGDLCDAFAAEGTAMQGAGMVRIYLNKVLEEMENCGTLGALRVGKLVEWGAILENTAAREDTRVEFAAMADPFQKTVGKLKDLIRNHFAQSLARFAALRDIRMEEDAKPWDVVRDLRATVEEMRSGVSGKLPPLAPVDIAVLDDVMDSVVRMVRELDGSKTPEVRTSLKREIDFQIAKVGATAGVYAEKAKRAAKVGGDGTDVVLRWEKRGRDLWAFIRWIADKFEISAVG